MTKPLVLSLFSGGGGGDVGLGRAGLAVVAHCEIEPHARAVLREQFPDVPLHGDVAQLDGAAFLGVDLVVGGSPCQDLSVAGKRAGLDGARSGLFYEQVRVWEESGAPNLLWENVCGALSSNGGRDFACILGAIVGAPVPVPADGWGSAGVVAGPTGVAAWRVLDLQHFGPPQRRRRVFVCGARAGGVDPEQVLLEPESLRGDSAPRRRAREGAAGGATGGAGVASETGKGWWSEGGVAGSLRADPGGMPSHIAFDWQNSPSQGMAVRSESSDSLRTNAVPAVLAFDTTQVCSKENRSNPQPGDPCHPLGATAHPPLIVPAVCVTGERTHALTSEGADASEDGTGRGTPIIYQDSQYGVAGYTTAGALRAGRIPEHQMVIEGREATPTVARYVRSDHYEAASVGSTLAARDSRGPQDLVAAGIPRRLTPRECERLMGWPDDYTRWGVDENGRRYELSDSARYRICGNGIGAPHTHWIGLRYLAAWQRLTTSHQERAA